MRKIPKKLLKEILEDKRNTKCIRAREKDCRGRITLEHAWIYAGRQINESWAIVPLCAYHHEVDQYQDSGDLDKELNQCLSLRRASAEDLSKYPKKDWQQIKRYLNAKYKTY